MTCDHYLLNNFGNEFHDFFVIENRGRGWIFLERSGFNLFHLPVTHTGRVVLNVYIFNKIQQKRFPRFGLLTCYF